MKRLKEGDVHEFMVGKKISDPLGVHHFILTGPHGKKYLLPADTYQYYNIRPGSSVRCRVDKINCRGEIFLEPENPHYTEGRFYDFTVTGGDIRTDWSGNQVPVTLVTDIFGNIIPVPSAKLPEKGSSVKLMVERISKGRLILCPRPGKNKDLLVVGRIYEFTVGRTAKGLDDDDYYILSDIFGMSHAIKKKYYGYYGFKPGDKIKGKVIKYTPNGERIIEPVNPYYRPGTFISLKIVRCTPDAINESFTLELSDKFGFLHCIHSPVRPESENIRCRVKMIRKGQPLLILL